MISKQDAANLCQRLFRICSLSLALVLFAVALGGCGQSAGSSNTTDAAINVKITTQPMDQNVAVGGEATFAVAATGTAPLTYRWQKNEIVIAGAVSSTYTTPAAMNSDNGSKYRVSVSNSASSATSSIATLTVMTAPTIASEPRNVIVTAGQTATFNVTSTGASPLQFQWQKNGVNISNATSASYTTPPTVPSDTGAKFAVVVSNSIGSSNSNPATLTVTSAPTISSQPTNATVTAGQTASFSVTTTGTPPLQYQWQKNGGHISEATSETYTTPPTVASDNGTKFTIVVSNSIGSTTSDPATLTVKPLAQTTKTDVITYHFDNQRTGQNLNETTLTTANVNSTKFGLLGSFSVDGKVDGQPLFLEGVNIPSKGTKNVLYVVTEHDSVFAFDADAAGGKTSTALWAASALAAGETPSDDRGCGQVAPEIGITSTPVIDRTRNAIYVVAVSRDAGGNYTHRIHALDLTTGKELFGGPKTIAATYPGIGAGSSNGNVVFDAKQYNERPGLLQVGSTIYTTWGSHCDVAPYTGWVMSYSADTLKQISVLNVTPNGHDGGIWMSGAAPAADAAGNIYFIVGNGDFGVTLNVPGLPANGNCGNCFTKVSHAVPMILEDYFTPFNTVSQSASDTDFGSGGPLLLPDLKDASGTTRHLAVGAGKDATIYVLDRDNMGKFNPTKNAIYQQIALGASVFSKPSYFDNTVYFGGIHDSLKAFPITGAKLSSAPSSFTSTLFNYPGVFPTISANGTSNAIVWAVENQSPAVLHAYDATDLAKELYNSSQAANGRDNFVDNKYITPVVTHGHVYVGTPNSVAVFGLLP